MEIKKAEISDAEEILSLQKLAYKSEADIYKNFKIAPMIQTMDDIIKDFKKWLFLKALVDKKIVGSVKGQEKDGTCHIGRLIVHPEFQNQGIGTALMFHIEKCFKSKRFELFTGNNSEKSLYLYHKLGYKVFKKEILDNIEFLFLEKYRSII